MVSSVARCWASAALPPLPKKRILPPPWMQASQASSIRRKAGPSAARVAAATAICSSNSLSNRLIAEVLHYSGEPAKAAAIDQLPIGLARHPHLGPLPPMAEEGEEEQAAPPPLSPSPPERGEGRGEG